MISFKKQIILTFCLFLILSGCQSNNLAPTNFELTKIDVLPDSDENSQIRTINPTLATVTENELIFNQAQPDRIPVIFSHGGAPGDIGAAVYFAKHPDVDLIGMVLSRGEFHPEIALNKWPVFIQDILGLPNTRIGLGSDDRMDSVSHEFPESWRPAADNFWGIALPAESYAGTPEVGHEMIINLVNASPEKVTIIAMASMIDVALALEQDPRIIDNIAHVVIMGGAFHVPGNLDDAPYPISNQVAEWNMWIDAEAAKFVFDSGVPISVVPLDATEDLVQPEAVAQINEINDPWVNYVAQMWNQQFSWSNNVGFLIWDTVTATAVTNPENFHWVYSGIDVVTEEGQFQGQTIPLLDLRTHIRYASSADFPGVMDQLFSVFELDSTTFSPNEVISELKGTWKGATESFTIIFTLGGDCHIEQVCGSFEIPDFALTGEISIVAVVGNKYEISASNLSSGEEGNPYEFLELLPDGTLRYFTTDYQTSSGGILYLTLP